MSVFRNYESSKNSENVIDNAHPVVAVYPWILQRNDFTTLVQPHEKGSFFTPGAGASMPKPTSCMPCGLKDSEPLFTAEMDGRARE